MKSLRALKATGLILAAVVLGLMTVQGSYALWNAAVPSNAGTIQAADFKVTVKDTLLSPGQELQLPAAKLSMASRELITPVSVASAVNVTRDSPFRSITTLTVNPVAAPLVVGVALSNTNGTCPAVAAMYKASAATLPQKTMVKQTFCFRTALKDGTTNQMLGVPVIGPSATLDVTQVASN
ncbi:hypothetical protein [Arthrobacter sunyaminii]|uniref:Uncharacterized protein n=1 Tax=Arthrobacter sunyaminii TaxID=2816859 RepID=A0A975S7E3_9MICC|nr:hypothetical protein [Arthrobacter sunyaminii]MBO0908173.1 hypothetical protein [Arthrobacter sunyaminii]QWQ37181.1 hypothetical protein KG104_05285 [Arthrobacter sunyaminii]